MNTPKDVLIVSTKDNDALKEYFSRLATGDTVELAPKGTKFTFTEFADDVARLDIDEIAFKGAMAAPEDGEDEPVSVKALKGEEVEGEDAAETTESEDIIGALPSGQ